MRELILAGLNRVFRLRGMELRASPLPRTDSSMEAALRRAAALAPDVATVVDVGAAAGLWTTLARKHFPSARYLLMEPLREREPELAALASSHNNIEFVLAAAGEAAGAAILNISADLDSSGIYGMENAKSRQVPVTSIDREIALRKLVPPYFIKLDTHGFERPILLGARETLPQTALIMVEVYNFVLCPGCLRFPELCTWLESLNFLACDVIEPLRRPRDGVLWQFDLLFAQRNHPAFSSASFR